MARAGEVESKMIKRAEDMVCEIKERMRGGEGRVLITHLLQSGEFKGKSRLIARLSLGPGCSIGYHDHQNEEEIFYVLSGQATLTEAPDSPEQTLRPGDAAITLGGEGHFIRNAGDEPLELLALILLYS
jgi:quercetin dioxygenase-like cupin family protein